MAKKSKKKAPKEAPEMLTEEDETQDSTWMRDFEVEAADPEPDAHSAVVLRRGLRNRNPGNLEHSDQFLWDGEIYPAPNGEERFCYFESPVMGIRALCKTLRTYYNARLAKDGSKIDTVQEVIDRWAPPSENNTDAYADQVRKALDVENGEHIDLNDLSTLHNTAKAITHHENGYCPYSWEQLQEGARLSLV